MCVHVHVRVCVCVHARVSMCVWDEYHWIHCYVSPVDLQVKKKMKTGFIFKIISALSYFLIVLRRRWPTFENKNKKTFDTFAGGITQLSQPFYTIICCLYLEVPKRNEVY